MEKMGQLWEYDEEKMVAVEKREMGSSLERQRWVGGVGGRGRRSFSSECFEMVEMRACDQAQQVAAGFSRTPRHHHPL